MAAHARLSPSGAERWMACPGSILAEGKKQDVTNVYAAHGSAAHSLLQNCLDFDLNPEDFHGEKIDGFDADEDMILAVGVAFDYVKAYLAKHPKATLLTEFRVDPSKSLKRSDIWGTADIVLDNYGNDPDELVIIDYKHGAGVVVPVERNPQLMIYLLGYRSMTGRVFSKYRVIIIQPRAYTNKEVPIKEWECDNIALNKFKDEVIEAAKATDDPNAPRIPGEHCRWCKALTRCKAVAERNLRQAFSDFSVIGEDGAVEMKPVKDLTPKEIAWILDRLPLLNAWSSEFYAAAVRSVWNGNDIPGYKPVQGRSIRQWTKTITEVQLIKELSGYLDLDILAPRSMAGIGDTEKAIKRQHGKETWLELEKKYVGRTVPPPHIAPETDDRPRANLQAQFTPIEEDILG